MDSRTAPALPKTMKQVLQEYDLDDAAEMEAMWVRIWRILSSSYIANLWMEHNRTIFDHEEISEDHAVQKHKKAIN
ncbi:hypothetical protein PHMEG_00015836 [Phytophthora megakarya]|uniref:Uncharacterized protein n=1 Tax=Phytophthora megakarya TaxID=4795 RepID=A0A225W097_9STRA|nr:hypothetical protein PHMEG_00015836 [Phytophthora megakarya]